MLPIHRLDHTPSLDALLALPRTPLALDWEGQPPPCALSFVVAFTPDALLFGGEVSEGPRCDRSLRAGEFVEGLWAHDVIEMFVREPASERYFEINLAPTGAFWVCLFESYRRRGAPLAGVEGALTSGQLTPRGWRAALCLPRAALPFALDDREVRANVCAIRGEPRQFFSLAPPASAVPDFHRVIAR